jgi:hypothetical protein
VRDVAHLLPEEEWMNENLTTEHDERTSRTPGLGRRSLVGGLVAGVLAAAGLELADAKKGGNGKGRGKGKASRRARPKSSSATAARALLT